MISDSESAWLEYQVIMGDKMDLENLGRNERELFKAVFEDGFNFGRRNAMWRMLGDGDESK